MALELIKDELKKSKIYPLHVCFSIPSTGQLGDFICDLRIKKLTKKVIKELREKLSKLHSGNVIFTNFQWLDD